MSDLQRGIETIIGRCLGVQAGEQVLIVTDTEKRALGEALRDGAAAMGAEAVVTIMDPREVDGQEPPASVAAALAAADVYLAPTLRSLSHTRARKAASDAGARGATLPNATEEIVARLMSTDFETMARRSHALAQLLTEAGEARFTCPNGSDMTFDLTGREGQIDDGDLTARGAFGNLPCGEGFISPLSGEGEFVVTTISRVGLVQDELPRLTVAGGRLTGATGRGGEELMALLDAAGEQGRNLAELGIGTNEKATLTGNILEDEKILGSLHVAFGASMGFGGTVSVPVHLDTLVLEPTLDIGTTRVLDAGRFVLDA